jgi:DNA invertase Pin-like site-specific DNA recombinase
MTRYGYVRTSTTRQLLDLQLEAMAGAGIADQHVYREQASGARDDRPVRAQVLAMLQPGDSVTVWRLDRWGRSTQDLLSTVTELGERGVHFESLNDHIDSSSATGRLIFHILAALAEFERSLTTERINAGLNAARTRGQQLGRRSVMTPSRQRVVRQMLEDGESVAEVARATGVSRATLYRHLDQLK